MDNNQYFKFEENGDDFPFYKDSNFLIKKEGILLLSSIILFIFLIVCPIHFLKNQFPILVLFTGLIPLLMITSGRLKTFFKKPRLKDDIELIILCVFASYTLIFVLIVIFSLLGIMSIFDHNSYIDLNLDLLSLLLQFLQVMGEEIFRVFVFLLVLHLSYRYSYNRKKSMILGVIIALFVFGLMHVNSYDNILYNIVLIGFGSFFTLYPYLKTKNLLLSIIVHFIVNIITILITTYNIFNI